MKPKTSPMILILTATLTGLIAGLFYAYSCSVNPGLARLKDLEYLSAMQHINNAILNPVFFLTFVGTLLLLPISTWLQYTQGNSNTYYLLLMASLIYIIGVFGITAVGNVPLNDMLAKTDLSFLSITELSALREKFEKPWLRYHHIRTISVVISFILTLCGLFYRVKIN